MAKATIIETKRKLVSAPFLYGRRNKRWDFKLKKNIVVPYAGKVRLSMNVKDKEKTSVSIQFPRESTTVHMTLAELHLLYDAIGDAWETLKRNGG